MSRIKSNLRTLCCLDRVRITVDAAIFLESVLGYLCSEVVELAGNIAKQKPRNAITPRHINLAVRGDAELDELLRDVTLSGGGKVPHISACLLPTRRKDPTHPKKVYSTPEMYSDVIAALVRNQ